MPSKRKSSACVDYVPALCTHRPSLLPIEWLSEALGLAQRGRQRPLRAGNLFKLGHLEEVKVVTRFCLLSDGDDHFNDPSAVKLNGSLCVPKGSVSYDYKQILTSRNRKSSRSRLPRDRMGDTVKLREPPKVSYTKPRPKGRGGQGNALGYSHS